MKKIVFIGENKEFNIKSLERQKEYIVIHLKNNKQAVKKTCFIEPDIIILEINTSYKKDYDLLREIQGALIKMVPVIIIGPSNDLNAILESAKLGVFSFISQPFKDNEFKLTLESAIEYSPGWLLQNLDQISEENDVEQFLGKSKVFKIF